MPGRASRLPKSSSQAGGRLKKDVRFKRKATVCKYIVPEGYPDNPRTGRPLSIGDYGQALLYYANVDEEGRQLITRSSRTLAFVGIAGTLGEAETIAEQGAASVTGEVRYRKDVGTRALLERRCAHMKEIR